MIKSSTVGKTVVGSLSDVGLQRGHLDRSMPDRWASVT